MSFQIKKGVKDPYVVNIQRALNEVSKISPPLKTDGDFGPGTEKALLSYQAAKGFAATGVYEGDAAFALDTLITMKYLDEGDYQEAAKKLGVDVESVKAVQTVESKGSGFLANGRLVILFERHVFKRGLDKRIDTENGFAKALCEKFGLQLLPGQQYSTAIKDHLAARFADIYQSYNSANNGYIGGAAEWDRLNKASSIDETCAMMAASYGLFQIMGFHWKRLGYPDVQHMVLDYSTSERLQLLSFCEFIRTDQNLLNALKAKDWVKLALGYNGSDYARNKYDSKLAAAYAEAGKSTAASQYRPFS